MSRIIIPHMNPLHLLEVDPAQIQQYVSKHMEDYWLEERLNRYQSFPMGKYYQPWQIGDVISMQFQSDTGEIEIEIIDCEGNLMDSFIADQKAKNKYQPEYFIYEVNMALNLLPEGLYWVVLKTGDKILISEPIEVLEDQRDTLYMEFSNHSYREGMIFETGFTSSIRVHGLLRKRPTASKDTIHEDQVLDMVMVKSKPYRIWELIMGIRGGIPDWFEDKLGRILGNSSLKIDGRYYTKNEGANLEESDIVGNGVTATFRIDLRESITRTSKILDTVVNTNEELLIMANTSSKGFGDTSENASSTIVTFRDVE